jgi:hypothetical protein
MHRFMWDMHYAPVPGIQPDYPISAVYRNTAPDATSPWAMPGQYTVVLNVDGKSYTQPLIVKIDPRVKTSTADLSRQFELSKQLYDDWLQLEPMNERVNSLNAKLTNLRERATQQQAVATQIDALSRKLQELAGAPNQRAGAPLNLAVLTRLRALFGIIQEVDVAPSTQVTAAVKELQGESRSLIERWRAIESQDIPALNKQLQAAGIPKIELKN